MIIKLHNGPHTASLFKNLNILKVDEVHELKVYFFVV